VGAAIDDKSGAVAGDALDASAREVFHVYVIVLNVRNPGRLGIEFGVHQAGLGRISAQLLELAGRAVEEPIVSARIGAPYTASIRKSQEALFAFRPAKSCALQRLFSAFRHEPRGRNQDLTVLARRGVVLYDITTTAAGRRLHRNVGLPTIEPARWRRSTLAEF